MSALLGFFTALPGLLSLINQLMAWLGTNPAQKIASIGQAFELLQNAKSQEERQNAASAIANTIAGL